jgi:hypothetical protein
MRTETQSNFSFGYFRFRRWPRYCWPDAISTIIRVRVINEWFSKYASARRYALDKNHPLPQPCLSDLTEKAR